MGSVNETEPKVHEHLYIAAKELTITLKHKEKPKQFKLKSVTDEYPSTPKGKFSEFISEEKLLAKNLDREGTEPRLVVVIEGVIQRQS